jgi:hypothetical protein
MISDKHRGLYRDYYATREIARRPSAWIPQIESIAAVLNARDVLDYGCGAARGISTYCKLPVMDYDPGVPGCDSVPTAADLVVSIHMLEHVEPMYIDAVLMHMQSLARKALLIAISCQESTKVLPDGSPWHSFVRSHKWWRSYLSDFVEQPGLRPGTEYVGLWTRPRLSAR